MMSIKKPIIFILTIIIIILVILILLLNKSSIKIDKTGSIVNVENFVRAETYMYMNKYFNRIKKTNTFIHYRTFETDNAVIRMNLDTLYSIAILDPTQNDIKINVPEVNDRYMSCCVLDEDHYEVLYTKDKGEYIFPKSDKYLVCLIRILVKDRTPEEMQLVNNIQDKFFIKSNNYSDTLNIEKFDNTSYLYTKNLILKLFETSKTMSSVGMFGKKNEINELKHIMGVAMGWGGLKQALYNSVYPKNNNGIQEYSLTFRDVPVNAFWSIIIYDKNGFIVTNKKQSLNNFTAITNPDGGYTINFTNNKNKINYLNIFDGWNYTIRMYEPKKEILTGEWKFPNLVEI
jgi:hypothetical protein